MADEPKQIRDLAELPPTDQAASPERPTQRETERGRTRDGKELAQHGIQTWNNGPQFVR